MVSLFFLLGSFINVVLALPPPDITGPTPPPVPCPNELCYGKPDGNYEYNNFNNYDPNYFVQCSNGFASCQACWPLDLVFSQRCNQCLYNKNDQCYTTKKWQPATTFECPDLCPQRGHDFDGNIEDPYNTYHYVACWKGVTVGCVACPAGLQFNEHWNACLYDGQYITEPNHKDSGYRGGYTNGNGGNNGAYNK